MKKIMALMISFVSMTSYAQGNFTSCDRPGGYIIFVDSMYGLGIGAVFSGLVLAASGDDKEIGQKVAAGGLIGVTAGMGLGLYELSQRQCQFAEAPKGWSQPRFVVYEDNLGLGLSYRF